MENNIKVHELKCLTQERIWQDTGLDNTAWVSEQGRIENSEWGWAGIQSEEDGKSIECDIPVCSVLKTAE